MPGWPTTSSAGNFQLEAAGGSSKLTDGAIGPVGSGTGPFATAGNGGGAGSSVIYTLPASANGYNLTNISVFSGWGDNGRDAQRYNVSYATAANPTSFISLAYVNYNPAVGAGRPSANRVMLTDSAGAPIAANVAVLKFEFTPSVENGYVGYAEITVEGVAAATVTAPPIVITTSNQIVVAATAPTWTIESDSLIAGQSPSAVGGGNFANEAGVTGISALTDGTFGPVDNKASYATCGNSAGSSVTYTLINSVNGSDLTNIVIYSGWPDSGRDGQFYNISYSMVTAPTTFIPLTAVFYNPIVTGIPANRIAITTSTGVPLAANVFNVRIDFTPQVGGLDNAYSGYAEIILEGTNSAPPTAPPSPYLTGDILPTYAETVVGDQVVFTAGYSNVPPANLQWQQVTTGPAATNNISTGVVTVTNSGVVTSTLTLNNVQVANSGSYRLKAVNATNALGVSFSAGAPLVVGNTPAPVNNVIVNYASQNFPGSSTGYFPAWPVDTNNLNLIYGFTSGSGEGTFTFAGDFTGGGNFCNADPTILSDGIAASMTSLPNLAFGAGGTLIAGAGGQTLTYTLVTNSAPLGLEVTNITVFGGWQDAGRDQQKYQVLYSTVQAPASFAPLLTVDYNPTDPGNKPSISRTTLIPASGVLAHNVAVVKFNWNLSPGPENGWEGYSEILVGGKPSTGFVPTLTNDVSPLTASDVVGSQIILTAGFSGADSLQWKRNGTNVLGATTSTLTLNNLQLTNAGAYTLVASNATGLNSTTTCTVTVNPAPTAVTNIITSIATQTSDDSVFTPTWDTNALGSSLIYNVPPSSSGDGDFTGGTFGVTPTGGSLPSVLTDGTFGTIDFNLTGLHAWVTCIGYGTGANNSQGGNYVIYSLPASANGYNITNIVTAGGWNDAGRDQQAYTVYYATVANPADFIRLASVNYNPVNPIGYSMNRATITAASGVLASNVSALLFDMTSPAGEKGFSGYSEIAAYGSPSATAPTGPMVTITTENQNLAAATPPSWVIETPNLIASQLPSSVGAGNFAIEAGVTGLSALTEGTFGPADNNASYATCGNAAGTSVTYTSATGWKLTNIVVYSGWGNYNRDGQFYDISYSTLSAPSTFVPLTGVTYNPPALTGPSANRVQIAPASGADSLATNVYQIKFDFSVQAGRDNGYSGYAEIVLQGSNLAAPIVPTLNPVTVSGGNMILTGTGAPNYSYTVLTTTNLLTPTANWTIITTGVTDGTGAISNGIPINLTSPASFFRLRMP